MICRLQWFEPKSQVRMCQASKDDVHQKSLTKCAPGWWHHGFQPLPGPDSDYTLSRSFGVPPLPCCHPAWMCSVLHLMISLSKPLASCQGLEQDGGVRGRHGKQGTLSHAAGGGVCCHRHTCHPASLNLRLIHTDSCFFLKNRSLTKVYWALRRTPKGTKEHLLLPLILENSLLLFPDTMRKQLKMQELSRLHLCVRCMKLWHDSRITTVLSPWLWCADFRKAKLPLSRYRLPGTHGTCGVRPDVFVSLISDCRRTCFLSKRLCLDKGTRRVWLNVLLRNPEIFNAFQIYLRLISIDSTFKPS